LLEFFSEKRLAIPINGRELQFIPKIARPPFFWLDSMQHTPSYKATWIGLLIPLNCSSGLCIRAGDIFPKPSGKRTLAG